MKPNGCDYMILLYISKHIVSTQTDFKQYACSLNECDFI